MSRVENLYNKIKVDSRHTDVIKLLDTTIEDRIYDEYNSGEFEVFRSLQI